MLVEDLLGQNALLDARELHTIRTECAQFISESAGLPLFKTMSSRFGNFSRVKVRMQKRTDTISEAFNDAFSQFHHLRQRAIFAYATPPTVNESTDSFYVFPIDGYKFLYSTEVTNSSTDYKQVVDTLVEKVANISKASDIITDLVKYTYVGDNLHEGIISESEIILYGIPHYYVIRNTALPEYSKVVSPQAS